MRIFIWVLAGILGLIVILLGLVYFLPGYDMYVVRSDSMKPAFSAGDVIVTASPGSPLSGEIQPGSIVTFIRDDYRITHRVYSMNDEYLITKGDANKDTDSSPVKISQVNGIYLLTLPYVGYLSVFLRTKLGWFLMIILPAIFLVSLVIKDIIREALGISKTTKI